MSFRKTRRLYEAKEYCMKLVNLESYNGENFFLLGKIYYKAGLKKVSLNYLKKAKSLNYINTEVDLLIEEIEEKPNFVKNFFSKLLQKRINFKGDKPKIF